MDAQLAGIAAAQGGVVLLRQAAECGYSEDEVRSLLRRREWVRLRRGAYMQAARFTALDERARHVGHVHAVLAARAGSEVVASHVSAAILHGLDTWGLPLSEVHVTRTSGASRHEGGVHHHRAELAPPDVVECSGLPTTSSARTVLDLAREAPFEPALVTADCALHRGLVTTEELRSELQRYRTWPGARRASRVVYLADGRSESVGETRSRVLFLGQGLPTPCLQALVVDSHGDARRVDFLFKAQRTIVEFDGRLKYGRTADEAADALVAERLREERLLEAGFEVVRLTWRDLLTPERTAARIRAAFARAALRAAS